MPRSSLHFSPLADLLGTLVLLAVPGFNPVVVEGLQLQVAGCGLADECHPVLLKLAVSPTDITLRLDEVPLLEFRLAFDRHERPELWQLEAALAQVREAHPEMTTVQLELDDDVELALLIAVADLCIGAGYPNILAAPDSRP